MIIIIINDDLVLRDAWRELGPVQLHGLFFLCFLCDVFFTKRFIGYALRSHGEIQVQTPE